MESFFIGQILVDIFLIIAAVFSLTVFGLLGWAAWEVIALVREVRGEVKIVLGTAQETLTEVRGTAHFVSDAVVQPISLAVGFATAARATARALTEPISRLRG
ncbi:MAG: hypothetical protein ACRDFS_08440 [Chloroflexota bacterium]